MEKPLSVDLQNTIIMVFHTILLLTKEFASQIDKCNSGPMIIESTGLTMLLTVLKQLPLYKAVGFFLWHSATVRWQQSGGMGQGSSEGDIFLESTSRIWCSFSTTKIHWSRGGKENGSTHYHSQWPTTKFLLPVSVTLGCVYLVVLVPGREIATTSRYKKHPLNRKLRLPPCHFWLLIPTN